MRIQELLKLPEAKTLTPISFQRLEANLSKEEVDELDRLTDGKPDETAPFMGDMYEVSVWFYKDYSIAQTDDDTYCFKGKVSAKEFSAWAEYRLSEGTSTVNEEKRVRDLDELVDQFCDENNLYNTEGSRGVRNLLTLVDALDKDYSSIQFFLEDNPGAVQALIDWISKQRNKNWSERLSTFVSDDED